MADKIKAAFSAIRASEEMKSNTKGVCRKENAQLRVQKALNYRRIIPAVAVVCLTPVLFASAGLYF